MSDVLPGVMRQRVRERAAEVLALYPDMTVRQLAGFVACGMNLNSPAEREAVLSVVVEWDCEGE